LTNILNTLSDLGDSQTKILKVLSDGKPKTFKVIHTQSKLTRKAAEGALRRLWKRGLILRTKKPSYEAITTFKGRSGNRKNTRGYHQYLRSSKTSITLQGIKFVNYESLKTNIRVNKAEKIREYIQTSSDKAFYTIDVKDSLSEFDVKQPDVMNTVRRAEKKGLIYVRGYRTHDRPTPFTEGYIVTWLNQELTREQAIEEAIQRTDKTLKNKASTSPIVERIQNIRDIIIEHSKLRDLVSFTYLHNSLGCSQYEAGTAVKRTLQLYADLREVKIFNNFRYYAHSSLDEKDLGAVIQLKENYIRKTKGRANRVGHNWEAIVGFFIDTMTRGARFWTQNHRTPGMDPRRITIHLIKSVGGRRANAEVDRVWEVTPGPLLQSTTYVLECKSGLVRKHDVTDFFEVLRWSKEFGVDTPDGREVKQGVVGVFASNAFNPRENVRLKDGSTISLASYAARLNTQLLKASDLNQKLREKGGSVKVTVQKIMRIARNESEVREILTEIWTHPENAEEILITAQKNNQEIYDFEKMLETN
jgi:hypothetical protein